MVLSWGCGAVFLGKLSWCEQRAWWLLEVLFEMAWKDGLRRLLHGGRDARAPRAPSSSVFICVHLWLSDA